ncbi:MAG: hypothetical protein MHM6MM_001431 [Cercozoa sp. M6MM]
MEMPVVQALLGNVLRQYGLQLANFEGLASGGCINNTFFIRANNEDFVLQRVNTQVFANVEALHNNIAMIAAHLQLRGMYCIPEFVAPRGSSSLFVRVNNEIWRLQKRVMNVHSQCDDKVAAAREVGNAFGAFLCALEGIDVSRLVATIPRFHDLELRLEQLEQAVKLDVCQRVAQCQDLLGVAMSYAPQMLRLWQDTLRNLPRRVTHNDTKIDNVLLDKSTGKARCIVDLDTVMPGIVHSDFGDAIRALFRNEPFDQVVFREFACAWLSHTAPCLTEAELSTLHLAPGYMCFLSAVRYLTDYLAGDVYFQIKEEQQNLLRARRHLDMCREMQQQQEYMRNVIASFR